MVIELGRAACAALLCAAAWLPACAWAQDDGVQAAVETVEAHTAEAYAASLAGFDAAVAAAPTDMRRAVARCTFIGSFGDDHDGAYVAGADEAFTECVDALGERHGKDPLVRVYLFEQDWLDEDEGETMLAASAGWPVELRRRVAAQSSWNAGADTPRAGELAVIAARLGDDALVARAVTYLAGKGRHQAAAALLEAAPPTRHDYAAAARVEAALLVKRRGTARAEVRRQETAGRTIAPVLAARADLDAGDLAAARRRLAATGLPARTADAARFDLAIASGDWATAAAATSLVRVDQFAVHLMRLATLAHAAPSTLLMPRLWPSLAVLAGLLAVMALLPGLLLVPVHYRGALRRLRGHGRPALFPPIGLRHAWMAVSALLIVPLLVLAVVDPRALSGVLTASATPAGHTLMLLSLFGSLACLAVLALPVWRFSTAGGFGWTSLPRAWWRVLVAWAGVLAVGALIARYHDAQGIDTTTDQIRMVAELVGSARTPAQAALAFFAVAVVVPLWEELAFRGLLLGGMARHISFGWANLVQALLFAAIHDDAPRFVYYLTLGLLAGWLVRSTRSLAPAVLLHMLVNALAFLLMSG